MLVEKQKLVNLSVFGIAAPHSQFTKKVSTSMLVVGLANGTRTDNRKYTHIGIGS